MFDSAIYGGIIQICEAASLTYCHRGGEVANTDVPLYYRFDTAIYGHNTDWYRYNAVII